jgi:hypothetical protein
MTKQAIGRICRFNFDSGDGEKEGSKTNLIELQVSNGVI